MCGCDRQSVLGIMEDTPTPHHKQHAHHVRHRHTHTHIHTLTRPLGQINEYVHLHHAFVKHLEAFHAWVQVRGHEATKIQDLRSPARESDLRMRRRNTYHLGYARRLMVQNFVTGTECALRLRRVLRSCFRRSILRTLPRLFTF